MTAATNIGAVTESSPVHLALSNALTAAIRLGPIVACVCAVSRNLFHVLCVVHEPVSLHGEGTCGGEADRNCACVRVCKRVYVWALI